MSSTHPARLVLTSFVLTAAILLCAATGFAQVADNVQVAANHVNVPAASSASGDINVSPNALLARIDAQQRQIDELKALVGKLQSRIQSISEPIASTHPMLPAATPTVAYGPDPAPSPAPSPAPAPAPAPPVEPAYRAPRELLPDIGHIGAEVGFLMGGATNPFKNNKGFATGGFIDLPFKNVRGGKISYEIMLGLQRSKTTQQTTSGVNVLANAIVNSYLGNNASNQTSLTNYLAGPLPITSAVMEKSKVLTVAPVLLKYSLTNMGRFRPYVVGGLGMYVWIGSNDNTQSFNANTALGNLAGAPVGGSTLGGTLNALLQGTQIGGLAPAAPELAARGVPQGQGNLMFGGQIGGGFEFRVSPKFSFGVDVRRNQMEGTNSSFTTFAFKQGLHW